jgi:hypothetical protein
MGLTAVRVVVNVVLCLALLGACYAVAGNVTRSSVDPHAISVNDPPGLFMVVGGNNQGRHSLLMLYEYSAALHRSMAFYDSRADMEEATMSTLRLPILWPEDTLNYQYYLPEDELDEIAKEVNRAYEKALEKYPPRGTPAEIRIRLLSNDPQREQQSVLLLLDEDRGMFRYVYEVSGDGITPLRYGQLTGRDIARSFAAGLVVLIVGVVALVAGNVAVGRYMRRETK